MKTKVNTNTLQQIISDFDLKERTRKREYVWNRSAVCNFLRKYGFSFEHIGRFLRLNHATVIHNIKLYENNIGYEDFQDYVKPIEIQLNKTLETDLEHLLSRLSTFEVDFLHCNSLRDYTTLKTKLLERMSTKIKDIEEELFTTFDI